MLIKKTKMARKDEILKSFLEHELLKSKYRISKSSLPKNLREGLQSKDPIVRGISLIVNSAEGMPPGTDATIYKSLSQYLNTVAI